MAIERKGMHFDVPVDPEFFGRGDSRVGEFKEMGFPPEPPQSPNLPKTQDPVSQDPSLPRTAFTLTRTALTLNRDSLRAEREALPISREGLSGQASTTEQAEPAAGASSGDPSGDPAEMNLPPSSDDQALTPLSKKERRVEIGLLLKERDESEDEALNIRVGYSVRRWAELYKRCYGIDYNVSGRERGMLRSVCKEAKLEQIQAAIVAMFLDYLSEAWYLERHLVPDIRAFVRGYDRWKTRGAFLQKFMNGSQRWWIVNKAGVDINQLEGFFLKVDREKGRGFVYTAENGVYFKRPLIEE